MNPSTIKLYAPTLPTNRRFLMAPVVDLPTELLFEVIAHLDNNDSRSCISLALTCRRFYDVFMPRIHEEQIRHFSQLLETPRLRINERIEMPVKDASDEDLMFRSVIADPFRGSIGRLEFMIGGSEKELQSVLGVISRAKYLEKVDLQLGYSCSQTRIARVINVCVAKSNLGLRIRGTVPDFRRGPFKYELLDHPTNSRPLLSQHSVQKIQTFKNRFIKPFLAVFTRPFVKAAQPQQQISGTTGEDGPLELVSSELSVSAVLREPKFRFTRHPRSQLSSFSIETDSLFLPSLYPVTLNALNHSPVHTLSICDTTLTLYDWSHILPSITMPALKCLSMNKAVSIAFPDLLAFLYRHQSIETLDFTANDVIGVIKFPSDLNLLPRLASITAHSGYIIPFMQYKKAGYLHSLHILSINGPDHDLEVLYNLLSTGGFSNLSIALDDTSSIALFEWILYGNLGGGIRNKHPLRLVGVTFLVVNVCYEFGSIISDWSKQELEKWEANHSFLVKEFEIKRKGKLLLEKYLQITEALIWSFSPQLKDLVFRFE